MCCNPHAKARTAALGNLGSGSRPFPIARETRGNNQLPQSLNIAQVEIDIEFTMCFSLCAGGGLAVERG